jgi:hypothetical protein
MVVISVVEAEESELKAKPKWRCSLQPKLIGDSRNEITAL